MKNITNAKARKLWSECGRTEILHGWSGRINYTTGGELFADYDGTIVAILGVPSFRWEWCDKCPADFAKALREFAKQFKAKIYAECGVK